MGLARLSMRLLASYKRSLESYAMVWDFPQIGFSLSRGLGSRRVAVFGFCFNLLASPNLLEISFCCSKRGDARQISAWPRYR